MKRPATRIPILTLCLTVYVAAVCLRNEQLNARTGSLPNREWYNNDPANEPVEWRQSIITNEARWRDIMLRPTHPDDYATRPLTDAQRTEMQRTIAAAKADNQLHRFVSTFGLTQYFAIPVLIILSIRGLTRPAPHRWAYALPLLIALLCAWRTHHLAYYASLGW